MNLYKSLLSLTLILFFCCGLNILNVHAQPMAAPEPGWDIFDIFTVGEEINGYTPPGVLDGLGAYELDDYTVRILANHELLHFRGYSYEVNDGSGSTFSLIGARISYFDIDKDTLDIIDSGLAYDTIYDANGNIASDLSFQPNTFATSFGGSPPGAQLLGFSRFCSSNLIEANQFGYKRGLADTIYFTGEEDGNGFSSVGGAEWALDPATGSIWALPDLGRGAWENITELKTGNKTHVALLLADDTSPFDVDDYDADQSTGDADDEAAPLYLYIGEKDPSGDFPARNGLRGGQLFVFVANNSSILSPADFNTSGKLKGKWVPIDNTPNLALASIDGSSGYDQYGYPTQRTLWSRAESLGAFGFSRPEDVATNPYNGREAVLASTGVDTFVGGVDTFGTIYTVKTNFNNLKKKLQKNKPIKATLKIIYDGDADPTRALRSPDNLDWADDGFIYIQEDEAEEDTLDGEPLFGPGAINPNEAGIVRLKKNGQTKRIANIDRSVILDASIADPTMAVDFDAGAAGEWESSGILDVSELFDEDPGSLFIFNVQAHGIEDQAEPSRIVDGDLVEGGQLLFLSKIDDDDDDDDN